MRGNRLIVWIDLRELLDRGNLNLNIELAPGDVVYVPDPDDAFIYVLGEVQRPGSYYLGGNNSLLNAIGLAGGLTENADVDAVRIVRDARADSALSRDAGAPERVLATVDLDELREGGRYARNLALQAEDVVYVPRSGVATFNYYLRMLNPFAQVFVIGNSFRGGGN